MNYQEAIDCLSGGCIHGDWPLTREQKEACDILETLIRHHSELDEERARHFQNAIDLERTCMQLGDRVKRLEADLAHANEELAAIDQQIANSPSSRPPMNPDAPIPFIPTGKGG